uniref:Uncharacterized protein n=1 Tax=viral metagenome TaxID=1070528 RepID=A0A6C0I1C2_9ZZZZ
MSMELRKKLMRDWRFSSGYNMDMYTQAVLNMEDIEYLYFTNFLLLLYRNNGKICDELVNKYLLTDIDHRPQLRLVEKEKRSARADADAREEIKKMEEDEKILEDNERRRLEDKKRKLEDEKKKLEDEKKKLEDEKKKLEDERRLSNERRLEKERLQMIENFINLTACELDPSSSSNQLLLFADSDQLGQQFCVYTPHSV